MAALTKKNLLACALLICLTTNTKAQSNDFTNQRAEFALFNIGLNGLIGGVGSIINTKQEKPNFETFANGFYKGAIGGYISHIGLSIAHQIDKKSSIGLAWPARLVNSLGSSIVQNAAEDKRMLERLHFNLYLARLEYFPREKKFNARLFTSSIYGLAIVGRGARFDLGKTLKTGIFYFESDGRFASSLGSGRATGQVSSIGMGSDLTGERFYDIYAEEVAHIMQYDRKIGGNALMFNQSEKWRKNSSFYQDVSKYIYFDLNGPAFFFSYLFEDATQCNFFEQEAVNYSNRRLDRCDK